MPPKSSTLADTKLVSILKNFSPREMLQLERFVNSPIHCPNEKQKKLFDILKRAHPNFRPDDLEKSKVAASIFPQKKQKGANKMNKKLQLLCTYLRGVVYDYFQWEVIQHSPFLGDWLLLKALYNRGIIEDRERFYSKTQHKIATLATPCARNYMEFYLISDFDLIRKKERYEERDIDGILTHLDAFYLNEKLKRLCLAIQIGQKELLNKYQFSATLAYIEHIPEVPLLTKIYYHILKAFIALIDGDEFGEKEPQNAVPHYLSLRKFCEELIRKMPQGEDDYAPVKDDLKDIYQFSIFIAKHLSRSIDMDYEYELFLIYDEQFKYKLVQEEGFIHHQHFKNIITLLLKNDKLDTAEKLMEAHKDHLHPKFQKDSYSYNWAHLNLFRKNYKIIHTCLNPGDFTNPNYKIGAYMIKLKAYSEDVDSKPNLDHKLELYECFLKFQRDTYRYLKREKKNSAIEREEYLNFVSFILNLMKIKAGDKDNIRDLKTELEACQSTFDKGWLMEQVNKYIT